MLCLPVALTGGGLARGATTLNTLAEDAGVDAGDDGGRGELTRRRADMMAGCGAEAVLRCTGVLMPCTRDGCHGCWVDRLHGCQCAVVAR